MSRLARAGLLAAWTFAAPGAGHAGAPPSFDYLHVRAHEGNATGGHVAIRFGAEVFDFQHADGLVVPRREDARRFQHLYRTLENRSIERSRIAASDETIALLHDAFERRLLAQSRQIEIASALARDVALLEAIEKGAPVAIPVRGAGFFAAAEPGRGAAALDALRERIVRTHGRDWLAQRDATSARALREIALDPPVLAAVAIDPLRYPAAVEPLSRRVEELLAARSAAALLAAPHALRAETLAGDADTSLDDGLRAQLGAWRESLLASATRLAASRRPDWGEAFLLAAARVAAIDASLASGRLVVLDALPASARALRVTARRRALVPALLAEARDDLVRAREQLQTPADLHDAAYVELEAAASRVAALRAVEAGAGTLRVAPGTLLPEGGSPVALEPRPTAGGDAVARALAATRSASAELRSRLADRYGYDLVRRNCVTEIFRTVEMGLREEAGATDAADVERAVREESERRLGGRVDPVAGANFVPFVSSRNVRAEWNVIEQAHLDSAREHAVARDGSFAARLRDSTALTASWYAPSEQAGFFVFFSDSPWPLRPLLGALNLASALLRSGVGLATLPFDRGDGVRQGLDGAFWSVPELVFANVRKGTNEWVPPELRPAAE